MAYPTGTPITRSPLPRSALLSRYMTNNIIQHHPHATPRLPRVTSLNSLSLKLSRLSTSGQRLRWHV
jgi:hypothetical protein